MQPPHHQTFLSTIRNLRLPSGAFESASHTDINDIHETHQTTFYASLICSILAKIPDTTSDTTPTLQWLLTQRSSTWTWNYWDRTSSTATTLPYPDDMDDTCAALVAITLIDPSLLTEDVFASIVSTLIHQEVAEGGPYETWILDHTTHRKAHEIDIAINAAIAHMLSLHDIHLDKLNAYIDDAISKGNLSSTYYDSIVTIIYFIARSYGGIHKELLRQKLLDNRKTHTWGNPLLDALALTAWIRLDGDPKAVQETYQLLLQETSMKPYPFFIERISKGRIFYSGCTAFTAAALLEACHTYEQHIVKPSVDIQYSIPLAEIQNAIQTRMNTIDKTLAIPIMKKVAALLTHDTRHEIALTPYFFSKGWYIRDDSIATMLGIANILGWVGYTIYDDLLDGAGNVGAIPIANKCVREVALIFKELLPDPSQYTTVTRILDDIESANSWEHNNCMLDTNGTCLVLPAKLPKYDDHSVLARKSLGHALGPVTLALLYRPNAITAVQDFFFHYLIARQLNDDAHDWMCDLEKGFLNSVSVQLIETIQKNNIVLDKIDLATHRGILQETFWDMTIGTVSQQILYHCDKALDALSQCELDSQEQYFIDRIASLAKSATDARAGKKSTLLFLDAIQEHL